MGPLLLWLLWPRADWCDTGYERCQMVWGVRQQADCCSRRGMCCVMPEPQGCVAQPQPPVGPVDPFNCADDYNEWQAGWSVDKKQWCCNSVHKGCVGSGDVLMNQAANMGYGAGAQHGTQGAQVAAITGIVPHNQLAR